VSNSNELARRASGESMGVVRDFQDRKHVQRGRQQIQYAQQKALAADLDVALGKAMMVGFCELVEVKRTAAGDDVEKEVQCSRFQNIVGAKLEAILIDKPNHYGF
jgi:hypothetical protein